MGHKIWEIYTYFCVGTTTALIMGLTLIGLLNWFEGGKVQIMPPNSKPFR